MFFDTKTSILTCETSYLSQSVRAPQYLFSRTSFPTNGTLPILASSHFVKRLLPNLISHYLTSQVSFQKTGMLTSVFLIFSVKDYKNVADIPWHKVYATMATKNHLGLFKNCKHFGRNFPHPNGIQELSFLSWFDSQTWISVGESDPLFMKMLSVPSMTKQAKNKQRIINMDDTFLIILFMLFNTSSYG